MAFSNHYFLVYIGHNFWTKNSDTRLGHLYVSLLQVIRLLHVLEATLCRISDMTDLSLLSSSWHTGYLNVFTSSGCLLLAVHLFPRKRVSRHVSLGRQVPFSKLPSCTSWGLWEEMRSGKWPLQRHESWNPVREENPLYSGACSAGPP